MAFLKYRDTTSRPSYGRFHYSASIDVRRRHIWNILHIPAILSVCIGFTRTCLPFARVCALLGKIPEIEEYQDITKNKINPYSDELYRYLQFDEIHDFSLTK